MALSGCYLVGCNSSNNQNLLVNALPYTSISPWVRVTFKNGDYGITVGNESSQKMGGGYYVTDGQINRAVIKSFSYGASQAGGHGSELTIIDEQGGNFDKFMQKLVKDFDGKNGKKMQDAYLMKVKFGWTAAPCGSFTDSGLQSLGDQYTSAELHFCPLNVTCDFNAGQIKFSIKSIDLVGVSLGKVSEEKVYGSDKQRLKLKVAIRQMFAKHGITALFLKKSPKGAPPKEWKFSKKDGGLDGPERKWPTNQTDPYSAAMNWLREFRTEDNKSFVATSDPSEENPTIIFWEDFSGDCKGKSAGLGSYGTYLVNGGECSPVIKFSPNIEWVWKNMAGGGSSGNSGQQQKAESKLSCDPPSTGTRTSLPISEQLAEDGKEAAKNAADSAAAAQRASRFPFEPFRAELSIQGDPKLAHTALLWGKTISLIVINPFHLEPSEINRCSTWLAKPLCNPIFTSENYQIQGVDHQIKEGSYVTTLQLYKIPESVAKK